MTGYLEHAEARFRDGSIRSCLPEGEISRVYGTREQDDASRFTFYWIWRSRMHVCASRLVIPRSGVSLDTVVSDLATWQESRNARAYPQHIQAWLERGAGRSGPSIVAKSAKKPSASKFRISGKAITFTGGFQLGRVTEWVDSRAISLRNLERENVFLLWSHDSARPMARVGAGLRLRKQADGVWFRAQVPNALKVERSLIDLGIVNKMSFGFIVAKDEYNVHNNGSVRRTLYDIDVHEISCVGRPAYTDTSCVMR